MVLLAALQETAVRVIIVAGCGWLWPLVLGTEKEHAARNSRGAAAPLQTDFQKLGTSLY